MTAALAADLEAALGVEAQIPRAAIVPMPAGTKQGVVDEIRADIESRLKRVLLPETTKAGISS